MEEGEALGEGPDGAFGAFFQEFGEAFLDLGALGEAGGLVLSGVTGDVGEDEVVGVDQGGAGGDEAGELLVLGVGEFVHGTSQYMI